MKFLVPYRPVLFLFILAPFIGEVLSTSTPIIAFLNPWNLFFLGGLYGAGAILIRELVVRWGKGWLTVLLLGVAYGIIEEGLAVKSFFDPNWQDLGTLVGYDFWMGVNWVWAVHLTLFHMVYSIAISILLTELTFPAHRHRAWTGKWTFRFLATLFAFTVMLFFAITENDPPILHYLIACGLVVLLFNVAQRLPFTLPRRNVTVPPPSRFLIAGFVTALVWFFSVWLMPENGVSPIILVGWLLIWAGVASVWILWRSGNGFAWNQKHQLALVSGFLGFLMLLTPLVGAGFCVYLLWLWRNLTLQATKQSANRARKQHDNIRR
ncbi:MAG: hypothetical protein RLP44_24485 [Aggregatilineales bacterium]